MQGHEMAIKKWFDHHWTFVLLVTKTSLVAISRSPLVAKWTIS